MDITQSVSDLYGIIAECQSLTLIFIGIVLVIIGSIIIPSSRTDLMRYAGGCGVAACISFISTLHFSFTEYEFIDLIIRSVLFGAIVFGTLLIALPALECMLRILRTAMTAIGTRFTGVWRADETPPPSSISPSNCLNDGLVREGYEVEIRVMQATELNDAERHVLLLCRESKNLRDILE